MDSTKKLIGRVVTVSVSERKGVKKANVDVGRLLEDHGLENDAHAGDWHRQVSLLAMESIEKIREKSLEVAPGDFAENITTEGIRLIGVGKSFHSPRPPNRACGSPAHGSPEGGFNIVIGTPEHGLRSW